MHCTITSTFLSTPSARRATQSREDMQLSSHYFYPRPPRGGRRPRLAKTPLARVISIHALREEGDCEGIQQGNARVNFYPRPPRGGRHDQVYEVRGNLQFLSTPSARRATRPGRAVGTPFLDFYPRPPRGGRRSSRRPGKRSKKFLSTPSARRATTAYDGLDPELAAISIHALREEGDSRPRR